MDVIPIFNVGDYDAQLRRGAQLIRDGKLVVVPTETVYGGAALLNHADGVARLRALRGAGGKPFTIHLPRLDDAYRYLGDLPELGQRMMRKLWPGPVALMFDVPEARRREVAAAEGVAESDIYEGSTITLRFPDHIVTTDLLSQVAGPVAVTRAGANCVPSAAEILSMSLRPPGPRRWLMASLRT